MDNQNLSNDLDSEPHLVQAEDYDGDQVEPMLQSPPAENGVIMLGEQTQVTDAAMTGVSSPINGENGEPPSETPNVTRADDVEAMMKKALPDLQDLEVEDEAHFTWKIEGWRKMARKERSPTFTAGGQPWRILFFPFGNNCEFASFYVEQGYEKPPKDWYCCAQFALVLWNPNSPETQVIHNAQHRFTPEEGDWGFTRFYELRKLLNKQDGMERPLVEDDNAMITAYVRVVKDPTGVLWHNFQNYDSKKVTGYVGLKNQGATCYLNSLLQSLYFTNAFRKAVYEIPTENEKTDNSALTLQRLFYLLQSSNEAVSTHELTRSFGWETKHIFEQQDVQELSRKLMERLEERMKGTSAENALSNMFSGKTKSRLQCINVDYRSDVIEEFWDIQLQVRGVKNLEGSFKEFVAKEIMNGENQYSAEGHGMQDAEKGVTFESFPPVLHLQLKRFEYDMNRDAMMKVNDRYEFPMEFNAEPYLSEDADKSSEPWDYALHGVLVHSGDIGAGHYYAFLKPEKDGPFYKFDDDRVIRSTDKEVLEENFGGDAATTISNAFKAPYHKLATYKRSNSAYMLIYLRKSRYAEILPAITAENTPQHLQVRLDEEKAAKEAKRKEHEERHLYMQVRYTTNEQCAFHQGHDLISWEEDEKDGTPKEYFPRVEKVLKGMTMRDLIKLIGDQIKADPEKIRLWVMVNRQNHTIRPDQPIGSLNLTVEEAHTKYGNKGKAFRLWVETMKDQIAGLKVSWQENAPTSPTTNSNSQTLIFLKYFDTDDQSLHTIGNVYMRKNDKIQDMVPHICAHMKWDASTTLKLFEEIRPQMIEVMKLKQTFQQAEIQDGDIISFQKSLNEKEAQALTTAGKCADVKEFYDLLVNRITVKFHPLPGNHLLGRNLPADNPDARAFDLVLSKKYNYEQLSSKIGEHVGVEPTHLRLWSVLSSNGNPKAPIRRTGQQTLGQMLAPNYANQIASQALFYEILEMSLSELETKKLLKFIFLSEGISKEELVDILVPKAGNFQDAIDETKKKLSLSDEDANNLRFYDVYNHRIRSLLSPDKHVQAAGDYSQIFAEITPEDELNIDEETEHRIEVGHFYKEPNKLHGVPFIFVARPGEKMKDTKVRLQARSGMSQKVFDKIKFAVMKRGSYQKLEYIVDDEEVLVELIPREADLILGMDHIDKSPKPNAWGRQEQSIFIR